MVVSGCGMCVEAYRLGRQYYAKNDYDVAELELKKPRMFHFLRKYRLIAGNLSDKVSFSPPAHL